ncbi:MAG: hypothetical protein WBL63_01000 [Candidatus Acidiferrum sp.]
MRKLLILALLSLGLAAFVSAGQRGVGPSAALPPTMHAMPAAPVAGGHAAPMRAPTAAHPVPHQGTPGMTPALPHRSTTHTGHTGNSQAFHNGNAGRNVRNNFCNSQPLNNYGANPTPGFGFDYEHFFAVHPTWNTCSQFSGPIVPFFGYGGGGYYPVPNNAESQQGEQENASNEQPDSNRLTYAQEPAASSRSNATYTPSEPVAEYVFVKRDGSTFNAVAYILLKDKIQYVTKDGLRRSVAIDSLDLDATQKSNEERGNIVTLPGHRA